MSTVENAEDLKAAKACNKMLLWYEMTHSAYSLKLQGEHLLHDTMLMKDPMSLQSQLEFTAKFVAKYEDALLAYAKLIGVDFD